MGIAKSLSNNKSLKYCVYVSIVVLLGLNFFRFVFYPCFPSYFPKVTSWWRDLYSLFHSISLDIVIFYVLYYLQVYLPEEEKKRIIKSNIRRVYRDFKGHVIPLLIQAGELKKEYDIEALFDIKEFNKIFTREDWYKIHNGLQKNIILQDDIIYELIRLRDKMYHVLAHLEISSDDFYISLENATDLINHYKKIQPDTDDLKFFIGFLKQIFTGWSVIKGQLDKDPLEDVFDKW